MLRAHATFMQPLQCIYRLAAPCAHSCSHYNAICIHTLQIAMEEPITRRNKRICNRPTYPSSPAAATLHRKTQAVLEVLAPSLVRCSGSPACCHGCLIEVALLGHLVLLLAHRQMQTQSHGQQVYCLFRFLCLRQISGSSARQLLGCRCHQAILVRAREI